MFCRFSVEIEKKNVIYGGGYSKNVRVRYLLLLHVLYYGVNLNAGASAYITYTNSLIIVLHT